MPTALTPHPPFNSAILFSGGGLRFGYYLGMYQALCDQGKKPDVILASCGGAFVAGLLELAPDPHEAFALMLSRDCYAMLCRITPNVPRHRTDYLLSAMGRLLASQAGHWLKKLPLEFLEKNLATQFNTQLSTNLSANTLSLLTKQSLAIIDNESETHPFWQFQNANLFNPSTKINSIILASELIKAKENYPTSNFQWQLLLRCSTPKLAQTIETLALPNIMANYNAKSIHAEHAIIDSMPLAVAVRASISDMFYLPPLIWKKADWQEAQGQKSDWQNVGGRATDGQEKILMGGVLNLTPIELACQLATTVYAETKTGYDRLLAEPAIQAVFGFSPNERLRHVQDFTPSQNTLHWIDTADNAKKIRPAIAKKMRLSQGYLDVVRPDFATYQAIMREQFNFGYRRVEQYLENI